MIIREHRGHDLRRVLSYVTRKGTYANHDETRVGPCYLLNSGFSELLFVETDTAIAIVTAVGDSRPDLKNRTLHLTFSPDPSTAPEEAHGDCLGAYWIAASHLGVTDRVAFLAFHEDGTDEDTAPAPHLHAVVALPSPETGQSVSLHRVREKLRHACDGYFGSAQSPGRDDLGRDPDQEPRTERHKERPNSDGMTEARPTPTDVQPIEPASKRGRRSRRRRKSDRGMDL